MLLIGVLVLAAVAVGMFFSHQKLGPDQMAAAERTAERVYQEQVQGNEAFRAECERAQAAGAPDADRFPPDCELLIPPREAFQAEQFLPPTFDFAGTFPATLLVFAGILGMVAFVVGASFVGAEWNTGGMMNLLLWRPRRLQVLTAKLGTLLATTVVATIVLAGAWLAAFWAIGTYRGTTAGMTEGAWRSLGLTGLRGLTVIVLAALVGFTVASIGRHTAFALGGAIAVVVVGQIGLGIALSLAQVRFTEAFLLPTHVYAWMEKKVTLQDYRSCEFVMGECHPKTMELTWRGSGVLFGVTAVVLLGAALWTMRRRDVT
jgi:ABC-type transport system involved in multi-copper enzyme maturation permease subunit